MIEQEKAAERSEVKSEVKPKVKSSIQDSLQNKSPVRGSFITFEGTEGAGKSTQIAYVKAFLEAQGIDVVTTREPGGTPLGESVRELLLTKEMSQMTELLLMFAARAEHIAKVILPAIKAGKWVLCDRFTESSYAYQGYARGLPLSDIEALEALVQGDLRPDCTFWFNLPVVEGMKRVQSRGKKDRFEAENIHFFEKVSAGFEALSQARPTQFCVIDAMAPIDQVTDAILKKIESLPAYQARGGDDER